MSDHDLNPWRELRFTVPLPPRGKATQRGSVLLDKAGNPVRSSKTGRVVTLQYKSKDQARDEEKFSALMLNHRPAYPLRGPILLGLRAYLAIPQSVPDCYRDLAPEKGKAKWFREQAMAGYVRPLRKPDFSNIQKHVEDIMNGVFWVDDSQIVGIVEGSGKYYGDPQRYEITIRYWPAAQQTSDNEGGDRSYEPLDGMGAIQR
jgi:Holliday junction resolvase RusA-like endonuclease